MQAGTPQNLLKYPYDVRKQKELVQAMTMLFQTLLSRQKELSKRLSAAMTLESGSAAPDSGPANNQPNMRLGEVNTLQKNFTAEVLIQSKWEKRADDSGDSNETWDPELVIENLVSHMYLRQSRSCDIEDGKPIITEKLRMLAKFNQAMYLRDFPVDTQWISITVTTARSAEEIDLVLDAEPSRIIARSRKQQEWILHRHLNVTRKLVARKMGNMHDVKPVIQFSGRVSRRIGFYVWNIIIIMAMIVALGFATYSIEAKNIEKRLEITGVLALTAVQFKIIVNKHVPRLAYLTVLHKYVIASMMYLCMFGVSHATIAGIIKFSPTTKIGLATAQDVQFYVLAGFTVVYAMIQVVMIVWIYSKLQLRRRLDEIPESASQQIIDES